MNRQAEYPTSTGIALILAVVAVGLCSSSGAVETLALNRTLTVGSTSTNSTSFVPVETVINTASVAGDVTVFASFAANPAGGGSGGRAGEWQLVAGGQQSTVVRRDMSDSSNDYGIMNLVWTFSNLAPDATVTLEHRSSNGLSIGTEQISMVTIPMTTEPAGFVLSHDLDDQGTFSFSNGSTTFVPVEKSDGSSLLATVQVASLTVPRDILVAAAFSSSKPQVGAEDGIWKLQYNEVGSPPTNECQDGADVGTPVQRSLSGNADVGAVTLYAIAEDLAPGTYEFRLCTASPTGAPIETFNSALVAFALHYLGSGAGGHFPRIQKTVAEGFTNGGNMEPVSNPNDPLDPFLDTFNVASASDVFLAMSFTAFTTTSGQGDFGEFETCIQGPLPDPDPPTYPFGKDQDGTSQEVRRRFSAADDLGAGGQVGLALNLAIGTYNARGCASVTGNPVTLLDPNLVGFVPTSVDDLTVPVSLAWFQAADRSAAEIEWVTATEVGNVGFHLYGILEGEPRRLNRELIPSRAVDSTAPTAYRFRNPGLKVEGFLLEDVDINGRSRFHGPFWSGEPYGKKPQAPRLTDWQGIRSQRSGVRKRAESWFAPEPMGSGRGRPPALNIEVERDGIYRLTHEHLQAAGVDLRGVPLARLALLNRGKPVPIRTEGRGRFGAGSYLEFVGRGLETLYTRTNVYTLTVDSRARARVGRDRHRPPHGQAPAFYQEERKVEVNRQYDFAAPVEAPWFDARLLAISGPVEATYALELDDLAEGAGPVELAVTLWGGNDFPQVPDHHVVVDVNGVVQAEKWFDGLVSPPIDIQIPGWLLAPSGNTLTLRLPHDTGAQFDLVNYDHYRVRYPRRFRAIDGELRFAAAAALFRVDALPSSEVVVYRVTDGVVEFLEGVQITGAPGAYSATFPGSDRMATYYVSTSAALRAPTVKQAPPAIELGNESAELLILSHPDFIDGIERLAQARRAQGYSVRVVDVAQLYQKYTHGVFNPRAIRTFIRQAYKKLETEHVLLVGGDTYDYHGYLGNGAISFLPTLYAQTDPIVRYAPADPLYGDVDGDQVPELAVGRLPVRDAAELELLIDKTLEYETRRGPRIAVAAADLFDLMSNTSFTSISESMLSSLPATWQIERAYIDDLGLEGARRSLLDNLDAGVSLASYFGHSGPTVWSFQGLFDTDDAEALQNFGRSSVVTQWGCWNTYFVSPTYDSLAHSLLLSGQQGAAAVLGATTLTQTASEQALGSRFFAALSSSGVTLGAALTEAKQDLAKHQSDMKDVILGWTLLGDPTLVVEP